MCVCVCVGRHFQLCISNADRPLKEQIRKKNNSDIEY